MFGIAQRVHLIDKDTIYCFRRIEIDGGRVSYFVNEKSVNRYGALYESAYKTIVLED